MRVLLILSSMAMGGAERNIADLLPHLSAQEGIQLTLGTLNTRRDSPLAELVAQSGVPRFDMGARRMVDRQAWRRYTDFLRRERIDLVHSQDQDTHVYNALSRRLLGVPSVMTRHVMFEPFTNLKTRLRAQLVLIAARYGADRVIAVSEAVRQQFARQARLPLERIETVYNGIQLEKFATRARRAQIRAALGWAQETPIVIMVAVLRSGKGHEVLFEAIPTLRQRVPNVQIMLVGDGEARTKLESLAAPYADCVHFLGQRMDVPELLGASDVLVLPSWSEALPTVLIEAGAASLPCVATDVGGTREIVVDGETGYIIPKGDSAALAARVADLLSDSVHARKMGEAALRRVSCIFTLPEQARRTVEVYRRALASHSR
ncbi:MAG: glycosyltransferase family 4 protein [Anaerolineae bacterium]|nr:glycosyltransferase family 4 protein [Anaerolineae bacterium]MDW8298703.1 glycosyltransferase family 4 protein [Anaerolineae bacterium]